MGDSNLEETIISSSEIQAPTEEIVISTIDIPENNGDDLDVGEINIDQSTATTVQYLNPSESIPLDGRSDVLDCDVAVTQITDSVTFKVPNNATEKVLDLEYDGRCQVCQDNGSGYHYSAYTCEGCKGFFKRTVQRNLHYTCKGEKQCIINKVTRNNCQACRYEACVLVGMKREAVREDRSPGGPGKNRAKLPRLDTVTSSSRQPFQDAFVKALYDASPYITPPADLPLPSGKEETDEITLNTVMHFSYMELRLIIDWAKKVPGFKDLEIHDQMSLLKSSFMELLVLRLAYRSMNEAGSVVIAEGLTVSTPDGNDVSCGTGLILAAAKFARRLRDIGIDIIEFCIINALVLTFTDALGLKDKQSVFEIQDKVVDSLRRYSLYQYPTEPHRYGKFLLRLPILRMLSAKAAEKFMSVTLDGNVPLSALVCEMMN